MFIEAVETRIKKNHAWNKYLHMSPLRELTWTWELKIFDTEERKCFILFKKPAMETDHLGIVVMETVEHRIKTSVTGCSKISHRFPLVKWYFLQRT